ncbi:hypothetical protein [Spirosoma utsteinense]|uniref:Tryptophan 2,3-dioxygenase n=1 Tax=Spirosoma utsteinense TaxID=2585773 RepID=A0ABR6W1P1_9BACT|nr:hypothetical protein [Spirosoma utsteinense]MBC3784952.1 hypothetical protein [Spirosoma utsteinense]MBC3790440.1 hypothetical protein [Spirosoma utsteinense]
MTAQPPHTLNLNKLLPEFRQCNVYADRLAFWQKHGLEKKLHYLGEFDSVDLLSKLENCQTWEELIQFDIITLSPFDLQEARQFTEWALQVRPSMRDAPKSLEIRKAEFDQELKGLKAKGIPMRIFQEALAGAKRWAYIGEQDAEPITFRRREALCELTDINIDQSYLNMARQLAHETYTLDHLSSAVRISPICMDWALIDKYLFAQSNYLFALYLENFDLGQVTDQKVITAEEARRLAVVEEQLAIFRGNSHTNNVKIMKDEDFKRLVEYTKHLVLTDSVPGKVELIPPINLTKEHIRYAYYIIHREVFGSRKRHPAFYEFLRVVFADMKESKPSDIKKKFTTPPLYYDADIKTIRNSLK